MSVASTPPNDVLYMAKAVIPHLFNRIYKEVEPSSNSGNQLAYVTLHATPTQKGSFYWQK